MYIITIYIKKRVPTTYFKNLPPRNAETSIISESGNFLNNLIMRYVKNIAIKLTYIVFKIAEEPQESNIAWGILIANLLTVTININVVASNKLIL